jgi:hypothetical protein
MTIKLTTQESEKYFHNALCNGLDYISSYGLSLDCSNSEYKAAAGKLKTSSTSTVCFEDVLMQILKDGKTITLIDEECDGEYTKSITMEDVHNRVQKTQLNHLMNMINENDDAETADVILQTVFFEDIIFG